jgi:hypothetical protein
MKQIITQLIDDFHERELPKLMARDIPLDSVAGKAIANRNPPRLS